MKTTQLYIMGLLTIAMHCCYAELPCNLPQEGLIATPNWFPSGPDGGAADDATLPEDMDVNKEEKSSTQKQPNKKQETKQSPSKQNTSKSKPTGSN